MLTAEQIDNLELVKYPAQALQVESQRIEQLDTWVERLARKMISLMYEHQGVGLAANQVGLTIQMFVANPTRERDDELILINPQIVDEIGWQENEEGCLSLPEVFGKVRRREKVIIEATDLDGKRVEHSGDSLLARIFQHEIDHLSGTLIMQRMSSIAKLAVRRQVKHLEQMG